MIKLPVPIKIIPSVSINHPGSLTGNSFTTAKPTAIDDSAVLSQALMVLSLANLVRSSVRLVAELWFLSKFRLPFQSLYTTCGVVYSLKPQHLGLPTVAKQYPSVQNSPPYSSFLNSSIALDLIRFSGDGGNCREQQAQTYHLVQESVH